MKPGVAVWVALAVTVPLAAAAARGVVEGASELAEAQTAMAGGDVLAATVHARRAAAWYVPGAAHVQPAYDTLREVAVAAETRGDRELALVAWRAIRTASLGSRWLLEPHAGDRRRADAAIARVSADLPVPLAMRDRKPEDLERLHAALLAKDDAPRSAWSAVLVLGFGAWVTGMAWLATRGFTRDGRLVAGPARVALAVAGLGLLGWVVALFQA